MNVTATVDMQAFAQGLRELPKVTSEEAKRALAKLTLSFAKAEREPKRSRRSTPTPVPPPVLPEPGVTLVRLALVDRG